MYIDNYSVRWCVLGRDVCDGPGAGRETPGCGSLDLGPGWS